MFNLPVSAREMLEVVKGIDTKFSGKTMTDEQAIAFCVLFSAYSMMKDLTEPIDCFQAALAAAHNLDDFEDMLNK
jgi:hypothetical protein